MGGVLGDNIVKAFLINDHEDNYDQNIVNHDHALPDNQLSRITDKSILGPKVTRSDTEIISPLFSLFLNSF